MPIRTPWDVPDTPPAEPVTTPAQPAPKATPTAESDRAILDKSLQPARERATIRKHVSAAKSTQETAPTPPPAREKDSAPKPTHPFFKPLREVFKGTAK